MTLKGDIYLSLVKWKVHHQQFYECEAFCTFMCCMFLHYHAPITTQLHFLNQDFHDNLHIMCCRHRSTFRLRSCIGCCSRPGPHRARSGCRAPQNVSRGGRRGIFVRTLVNYPYIWISHTGVGSDALPGR